jgi:hypothetical protein
MTLGPAALLALIITAPPSPEMAARVFLQRYIDSGPLGGHLEDTGGLRRYLTPRLRHVLDDASACQRDWGRKLPKDGLIYKPPFVDCCLFSSGSDGMPSSFRILGANTLPDGRQRVDLEYTIVDRIVNRSPDSPSSWTQVDAVVLALVKGRYLVDDFVYLGEPASDTPVLLSESFHGCKGSGMNERPPSNNELQRTSHGQDGGSPLNSVLDGRIA